jgi:hypothetical protein
MSRGRNRGFGLRRGVRERNLAIEAHGPTLTTIATNFRPEVVAQVEGHLSPSSHPGSKSLVRRRFDAELVLTETIESLKHL